MDKENFYQILDEFCSYNPEVYFSDPNWYNESLSSQVYLDYQGPQSSIPEDKIQKEKDTFHKRKHKLFEKMVSSYEKNAVNGNNLLITPSHPGEKYAYLPYFNWSKFLSFNNEDTLKEFKLKLKEAVIGDFFYEPINKDFNIQLELFIQAQISSKEENEKLKLGLECYGCLCILQGRLLDLAKLIGKHESNEAFTKALKEASKGINETFGKVLEILAENNFNLYPIMRNYSIVDVFNANKNILFATKNTDSKPYTCITTDSKYIYVILYGICGGLFKIGTGKQNTIRGHIYKYNSNLNTIETNPMLIYVKASNRLYLKTNQMELGQIKIINPDTLLIESIKVLNLPEKIREKNILEKNTNFILLGDESNLYAIALEPDNIITKPEDTSAKTIPYLDPFSYTGKTFGRTNQSKSIPKKTFESVSLILFKYSMNTTQNKIKEESDNMVNELYESFSCIFSKEKCRKALEKKSFNMEKAAGLLIKKHNEITVEKKVQDNNKKYEELFYYDRVILYQSKVDIAPSSIDRYMELTMIGTTNLSFDPTKYDLLKWVIAKDNLYGYKLKQGACFVFNTLKKNEKEFIVDCTNNHYPNHNESEFGKRYFNKKTHDNDLLNKFKDFIAITHPKSGFMQSQQSSNPFSSSEDKDKDKSKDKNKDKDKEKEKDKKINVNPIMPPLEANPLPLSNNNSNNNDNNNDGNNNTNSDKKSPVKDMKNIFVKHFFGQSFPKPILDESYEDKVYEDKILDRGSDYIFEEDDFIKNQLMQDSLLYSKMPIPDLESYLNKEKTFLKNVYQSNPDLQPEKMTFKGTLVKVLHCLSSNTISNIGEVFCYDETNSCYYILAISILSISILVLDTFEEKNSSLLKLVQSIPNSISLKNIYHNIKGENNIMINSDYIINMILNLSCYCYDLPWRYSNWNFFYSNLNSTLGAFNEDRGKCSFGEYPYKIFPKESAIANLTEFDKKLEQVSKETQEDILSQIEKEFNIKLANSNEPKQVKKKALTYNINSKANTLFSWENKNDIYFESLISADSSSISLLSSPLNKKAFAPCLFNHRKFFCGINGSEEDISVLFALITTKPKNLKKIFIAIYFWILNLQYSSLLEITDTLYKQIGIIRQLIMENIPNDSVREILFKIIIEGFEIIFPSLESQGILFIFLYSLHNEDILKLFMSKFNLNNYCQSILLNTFHRVNNVKIYSIKQSKSKPNQILIGSTILQLNKHMFSYPFHLVLYHSLTKYSNRPTSYSFALFNLNGFSSAKLTSSVYNKFNKVKDTMLYTSSKSQKEFSKLFWDIIEKEIINKKSQAFIEFFIHLYIRAISFSFSKSAFSVLFNKSYSLLVKLLNQFSLINTSNKTNTNTDEPPSSVSALDLAHVLIYSYFSKYHMFTIENINSFIQKNNYLFTKILQITSQAFNINKIELLGRETENEKYFEYNLRDDTSIQQVVSFPNDNIIVVEIEMTTDKSASNAPRLKSKGNLQISSNLDLIIRSSLHSNSRSYSGNNHHDFGTCFMNKIHHYSEKKRYYLLGNEITINTPPSSESKYLQSNYSDEFHFISTGKRNKSNCNSNNAISSKLIIKCYPLNDIRYGRGLYSIDQPLLQKGLRIANEADYFNTFIYKKMINSTVKQVYINDNPFSEEYDQFIESNTIKRFEKENINKRHLEYDTNLLEDYGEYIDNETNQYSVVLKYIEMRKMDQITEVKEILKNKQIEKDIQHLTMFNTNLWNFLANISYCCYNYHFDSSSSNNYNDNNNNDNSPLSSSGLNDFIVNILSLCVKRIKLSKITYDNIRNLSEEAIEIIEKASKKTSKNEINDLVKEIRSKISEEIKAQYYSNESKLNEACELNLLLQSQEDNEGISLDDKLSLLTNYIIDQIAKYTSFTDMKKYNKLTKNEIMSSIKMSSPYVSIPIDLINKLLFLMNINKWSTSIDLMKKFLYDEKISLSQCLIVLYSKSRNEVLKDVGIEKYSEYLNQVQGLTNYANLFDNTIGVCYGYKKKIESIDSYDNKTLVTNIDYISKIVSKQLKKQMTACIRTANKQFHINQVIQLASELNNLFSLIPLESQKTIEKNVFECLKSLFANQMYQTKNSQSLFESFNVLTQTIAQIDNSFTIEVLKMFSDVIAIQAKDLLALKNILSFLQGIHIPKNENINSVVSQFINNIFNILTCLNKSDTLNYLCKIAKIVLGSSKGFKPNFDKLYNKIGQIINIDYNINGNNRKSSSNTNTNDEDRYKVIINANSNELDYNFLLNALYYFEEKYPTNLSIYIDKAKFAKAFSIDTPIENMTLTSIQNDNTNHPVISLDLNSSSCSSSSSAKYKLLTQQLHDTNIKKDQKHPQTIRDILPVYSMSSLSAGTYIKNNQSSSLSSNRLKSKEKKTQKLLFKCEPILKEIKMSITKTSNDANLSLEAKQSLIDQYKIEYCHISRIMHHIHITELIGEIACNKGFAILSNSMTYTQAIAFSEFVHLALNNQLKSPPRIYMSNTPLFDISDIFPPLPNIDELVEGYTNIIKETTMNYANVTLIKESMYNLIINNNLKTIHLTNLVAKEEFVSGEGTISILEDLIGLIYDISEDNQSISNKISSDFNNYLLANDDDRNNNKNKEKANILLGVTLLVAGEHYHIREGQNVYHNNKEAIVVNNNCDLRSQCEIIYLNSKTDKRIKVSKDELALNKKNEKLIKKIDIISLIKIFLNSISKRHQSNSNNNNSNEDVIMEPLGKEHKVNQEKEKEKEKKENISDRLLLHYLLKILSQSASMDLLPSNTNYTQLINQLYKIVSINLNTTQNEFLLHLENKFISKLIHLFNKLDKNFSTNIFIPRFNLNLSASNITQLPSIINYVLPESTYLSTLPQISFTKCIASLNNAIKFDKTLVEAIINAYKNDKYPNAVAMSTSQIRSHILNGNLKSAYNDLGIVFGGAPITRNIFSDEADPNELTKENCFVGKIFLCNDSKLPSPLPIIILLNDFIHKAVLVMTFNNSIEIFWTFYETLSKLSWEYPSNSYPLIKVYNDLLNSIKELDALYSGQIIMKIEKERKRMNENEVLSYAMLSNSTVLANNDYSGLNTSHTSFNMNINKGISNSSSSNSESDCDINELNNNAQAQTQAQAQVQAQVNTQIQTQDQIQSMDLTFQRKNSKSSSTQAILIKDLQNIPLYNWTLLKWKSLMKEAKTFYIDLFSIAKDKSGSLIPLHDLLQLNDSNTDENSSNNQSNPSAIIISFDQLAYLGPQATLKFYSDSEGVHQLSEVISIKKEKTDLQSIIINSSRVYMEYIPGTTIFYNSEWFLHSRDSYLPCSITFIPHYWTTLLNITNIYVNKSEIDIKLLSEYIKAILPNCLNDSIPIEFQMKIMQMVNRIISKNKKNLISLINNEPHQEGKLNIFGLTAEEFNSLITKFNSKFSHDKLFASPYIIELSEYIIHIYSALNDSIANLSSLISIDHQNLTKLYELVRVILEEKKLMSQILEKEIIEELMRNSTMTVDSQLNKIFIVTLTNTTSKDDLVRIINEEGGIVQNREQDIIQLNDSQYGILIEKYNLKAFLSKGSGCCEDNKNEEEIKEEALWDCAECTMQNDKENTTCVFCDSPKKLLPKSSNQRKAKDKQINSSSLLSMTDESLIHAFKEKLLSQSVTVIENTPVLINDFLSKRHNAISKDNLREKINHIGRYISNKTILNDLFQPPNIQSLEKLFEMGIDLYYDVISLPQYDINMTQLEYAKDFLETEMKKTDIPIAIGHIRTGYDYSKTCLAQHRYNCSIINKLNQYLQFSLPLINPPDTKDDKSQSSLLSKVRSLIFISIKSELINDIISLSEYNEDVIQIPTFKIDRINSISSPTVPSAIESSSVNPLSSFNAFQPKASLRAYKKKTDYYQDIYQSYLPPVIGSGMKKADYFNDNYGSYQSSFSNSNAAVFKKQIMTSHHSSMNANGSNDSSLSMSSFHQVYDQALNVDTASYRSKKVDRDHNAFKIEFVNENVQGLSGPYRQFFSDITNELMIENKPPFYKSQLLIPTQNNQNKKGEYKDKFTINPNCNEYNQYEFLGLLMGICIRTGVYLPIDFCSLIWKKIVSQSITIEDMKQFDEGLYQIHEILINSNQTIPDEFKGMSSITLSDCSEVPLNIEIYKDPKQLLKAILHIRYNECSKQIKGIQNGISKVLPISLIKFLTWKEFERLVCGIKVINIELLKKNTIIAPELLQDNNYLVKWLWEILDEFNDEQRVSFVKFCYAQERLPPNQDEYTKRQIVFTIKLNANSKKDFLPRADTCFFFLIIPEYSTKEVMKKMICIAMNMDNVGMNGDRANDNINSGNNNDHESYGMFRGMAYRGRGRGGYNLSYEMNDEYDEFY